MNPDGCWKRVILIAAISGSGLEIRGNQKTLLYRTSEESSPPH
jgi:hypothetical protein